MKVGDKLLCKKDEGEYYTITEVYNYQILTKLLCKKDDSGLNFVHKGEYYTITEVYNYQILTINNLDYSLNPTDYCYIWNFFYTLKELRKLKLKQLKQC